VASIEAQIQLILKGSSEIDKLQKKLDSIEDTAASIQDQFERGLFGRSSNLQAYMNALSQIGKAASAVRDQTKEIQSSNSEIKRTILLESQLRRERSRTARLSRAFEAETKGLDQTRGKLKEVKEQFDAISGALGQAFKLKDVQIVSQLRNELSALVEDQREWNRALAGTKNTGVNADLLKEQSAEYARQISLLRERAEALGSNEALIRKLNAAERNLVKGRTEEGTFLSFADPRLGREQLKNARALIQEEERLAETRKRSAAEYENQQKQARREIQQTIRTIGGLAQKATGATFDALTFGKGPQIAKGFKNAAIRGGVGLGALGLGGAYAAVQQATGNIDLGMLQGPATQAASAIGGAINNALGGVPAVVAEMLSALGNIPGSLGLASVAALAFAPAMKTAGEAVFLAGKKFGESKFGENIKLTLDRQTNLFESVINKASEMNMVLDASRSGLDAVGRKIETLPALPAAGQTAFRGELRRGRGGAFIGGGAREITNPEFLATAAGTMAQRTQEAAQTSLMFAEGLGQAANEAKTIAEYLRQANELRAQGESSTQRFIRQTIERGRIAQQGQASADIARERSAFFTGSSYSLAQVPVRGELFPGGRTETAMRQYRDMLNTQAFAQQALEKTGKSRLQTEAAIFRISKQISAAQAEQNALDERSVQLIREQNALLLQQYRLEQRKPIAAMTPEERVSGGILDPSSLRASRRERIKRGRARQESIRRATSEGLIGGAFPLLFGQGPGAAVGGGAGGALGGFAGGGLGFGLSLVGTALGTAFDQAVQSAKDLGAALEKPVENFDQLAQQSFFSSKALEETIKKAIEFGDTATASSLIQEEAIKKLGVDGVRNLQELASESDQLGRALGELGQNMLAVIAGPLAKFTAALNNLFEPKVQAQRVGNLRASLAPQQREALNKELLAIGGPGSARYGAQQKLSEQGRGLNLPEIELAAIQAPEKIQAILDKYEPFVIKGQIKLDPKQQIESEINALQKRLEAIDISKGLLDQVRSANREQEDLDKQRADLIRSYEESIGDIRKRIEDEVRNRRLAVLETENKILNQQGQNRINQLRLINQQFVASAGQGQRPEVEDAAKRAAQIVAQFTEQQLSAEEEAAQIKRNASLDALKFDTEAAEFKANIEKEISRLNIETARRVDDINLSVARRNEEYDQNRFKLEKRIAQLQLKNNEIITKQQLDTANKNLEAARQSKDVGQIRYAQSVANIYQAQLDIIQQGQKDIAGISAPAKLTGIPTGAVGGGGVSTRQFDAIIGQQKDRMQKLVSEILAGLDLTKAADIDSFKNQVADLAKSFNAPIVAFAQNFNDELQASSRYIELLNQGLKGTTAQQVIQLEQQRAIAIAQYNQAIASLEERKNAKDTTELAKGIIESQIVDLQNARNALLGAVSTAVKDVVLNESIIAATDAMRAMKEEMNELLDKVNQAKFASETLGRGIAGGITDSISVFTGFNTMTERRNLQAQIDQFQELKRGAKGNKDAVQEYKQKIAEARSEMDKLKDTGTQVQSVLANMLKGIGEAFVEMAQKIIAQQVTMIIFGTILKALGIAAGASGGGGGGKPGIDVSPSGQIAPLRIPGDIQAANGAYFDNGIAAFANGGMFTNSIVSSPTLFQFADGGVTRTGVMGEAGPEAIMPLERGADGKLGVKAKLNGAMTRYRRPPGADAAAEPGSGDSGSGGGGVAVTAPIDVRYTVERINSVDYVTADQFQAGLRQAADQGARQGERRALTSLRQNTTTRRKVGI